jgi:hypothetical protein
MALLLWHVMKCNNNILLPYLKGFGNISGQVAVEIFLHGYILVNIPFQQEYVLVDKHLNLCSLSASDYHLPIPHPFPPRRSRAFASGRHN